MKVSRTTVASSSAYLKVPWYKSVVFRIVVLCALLLFLLLAMVETVSHYLFHEIRREMELLSQKITLTVQGEIELHPGISVDDLRNKIEKEFPNSTVELIEPNKSGQKEGGVSFFWIDEDGTIHRRTATSVQVGNRWFRISAEAKLQTAQTLLFNAMKNRYLLLLALGFVVTLGLMVYFIRRVLRPLGELSESCAQISEGNLKNMTIRKSSGEVRALEQTFNRMVASLRDKEIVEANLRQAQRLTAIGTLAAGVAHDIRNPLNAIKLLSSHTLDQLNSLPEGERAAHHVQTIRSEVDRLEEIVSGFLSLAKERDLRPEPSKIDNLLHECVRLIQPDAEAREVRLTAELRAGDTTLMLDPKQWTRAVLNVLINALEVCPKGGRVRLFSRLTDTTCEVEVRDDGPGLSKEAAEHAFDPYFTTKTTGTGLGLSITRGIVEEHGGAIQLTGSDGHGCQVLIRLPLDRKVV